MMGKGLENTLKYYPPNLSITELNGAYSQLLPKDLKYDYPRLDFLKLEYGMTKRPGPGTYMI